MNDPKHPPVYSHQGERVRRAGLPFFPFNTHPAHTGYFLPHIDVMHGEPANTPYYGGSPYA